MRQIKLLYNLFIIYNFLKKKFHFERKYAGTFDVSCGMFSYVIISNVISLVLRDSDRDSEVRKRQFDMAFFIRARLFKTNEVVS